MISSGKIFIADTYSEIPKSRVGQGDLYFRRANGRTYQGTQAGTLVKCGGLSNQRQVAVVDDEDYTIDSDDDLIVVTDLSASRNLFLPPLADCEPYRQMTLLDESGLAAQHMIVIVPDGTDTINGIVGPIAFPQNNAGGTIHPVPARNRWNVEGINFPTTIRFHAFGVNGKTVGNTFITAAYNVADKPFFPKEFFIYVKTVSGLILAPTISMGTNSPNYNNIVSAYLVGATQANKVIHQPIADAQVDAVQPGEAMYLRVSIAATGTTYTFDAYIEGFYN